LRYQQDVHLEQRFGNLRCKLPRPHIIVNVRRKYHVLLEPAGSALYDQVLPSLF